MDRKRIFTALCMALLMSFFMSFVMTAVNVGFTDHFPIAWSRSWAIGFIVALPLVFILPPSIQKIGSKLNL